MNCSVEAESSQVQDCKDSGSEATMLRGPMGEVDISPLARANR